MHSLLKIAGAVIVLAAYVQADPAAANSTSTRTERVEYRAAETLGEAGVRRLYRRLDQAAMRACTLPGAGARHGRAFQDCRRTAVAEAVAHIDAPQLSALVPARPVVLARR